jgi:formylglycine-generating enzyme required for sulfatase activity
LPTEAEWEYAARAGTNTPFYTGNCISTTQANYDGNYDYANCGAKTGTYKQTTVAIGSYSANPWGLHDMAGNVWEWTCSDYVNSYDSSELKCSTGNTNTLRVLRGGSWNYNPGGLRSADRNFYSPGNRGVNLGFRLSRM